MTELYITKPIIRFCLYVGLYYMMYVAICVCFDSRFLMLLLCCF